MRASAYAGTSTVRLDTLHVVAGSDLEVMLMPGHPARLRGVMPLNVEIQATVTSKLIRYSIFLVYNIFLDGDFFIKIGKFSFIVAWPSPAGFEIEFPIPDQQVVFTSPRRSIHRLS